MGELVNLSFKVPKDVHKKLKILATIKEQSMGDIIIDFVRKQKLTVPSFDDKPEKTKTTKTENSIVKKPARRKDENPDADERVIKAEILRHKAAGLSLQRIADALQADKVPSLRGGKWRPGTIDGLLSKWAKGA